MTKDTEALRRQRAKSSKINGHCSWPTCKNCSYHCAMCTVCSIQYCSTETVLLIFSFLQSNITSQIWPRRGNGSVQCPPMHYRQGLQHWPVFAVKLYILNISYNKPYLTHAKCQAGNYCNNITHSNGSARVFVRATKQVNGESQNLTPRHAQIP